MEKRTRHQLLKHHSKAAVAEIERELGADCFTRLAVSRAGDATWSLSPAEIIRFARGLPAVEGPPPSAEAPPDARGKHMVQLQVWRVPIERSRALIEEWYGSVPVQTIKDAFDGAGKRTRGPAEAMKWLESQIAAAILDPRYRVPTRAPRATDGRALREVVRVFEHFRREELSVAEIAGELSHITRESLRTRLSKLALSGEIEQAEKYGHYRLRRAAS